MCQSYPTPAHIARVEQLRPGFAKIFLEETGRPCHFFTQPDGPLLHDHPHGLTSHVLEIEGNRGYVEEVLEPAPGGGYHLVEYERLPGTSHRIEAGTIRRVKRLLGAYSLTHIEPGPPENRWGFYDLTFGGKVQHRYADEAAWQPWPRAAV